MRGFPNFVAILDRRPSATFLSSTLMIAVLFLSGCSGLVQGSSSGGGTPLAISNVAVASATLTGASVTWQTNVPANSLVEYGLSASYGSITALDTTMVTSHGEPLANLKPGTLYHYRVHSTDASNGSAVSGDLTFTTLADTTPPTVSVTSPTANATISGTVSLAASATDDVAVAGVQFKVDNANTGPLINVAPFTYMLNTTTFSDGNHIITALATDTSGNSASSSGVAIKIINSVLAPSITSLNPTSGVVGTSVTIAGANFGASQGTSTVKFNGTTATPTSWSATSITALVPAGATTGNVVITVGGVASNGVSFTVSVPGPSIASLNPTSGVVGASVTVTGANFGATQGASTLTFSGTTAAPTSWSATSIVAPVPAGATTGNVVVTVGGLASNGINFAVGVTGPSIANLNPTSGMVGATVTIAGANFGATQGTSTVKFNGAVATPTSWSATSLVVSVPAAATTGNVVVTVGGIASNGMSFTVTTVSAPSITSLNPTSAVAGMSVTIAGANFGATQGTSTLTFNGTAATPTSWSATSIVAPVPAGATTGNVVVTVGGVASNGVAFTITTPAPSITSLNPTTGPVATSVTITGGNFGASQGTSTVSFNGTAATPSSWSATSIAVPVPSGATTGNVVVTVGGMASNGVTFTVTTPGPSITSLNPTSGAVGTSVTITGANFGASQGTSTVTFNGTVAAPTSWSATSLVAPVPPGATTGNVVVTVGGVVSNGTSFTVTTSGAPKLPIKASANNRYFVDQNNVPWLMVSDTGHHIMNDLAVSGFANYLSNRQSQGFNSTQIFATCAHGNCPSSSAAVDGTLPFTTGNSPSSFDLSTPNNAYWAEVDNLISQANALGMVVVFNPLPIATGDFLVTYQNNGATKCFNFGVYIGTRYKNFPNIIWYTGNDFYSWQTASDLNLLAQFMAGIASVDPNHLDATQLSPSRSYSTQAVPSNATYAANLTGNYVYTYYEVYDEILAAYNSTPTLPVFLGETNYETGNNTGALSSPANAFITRQEMWYAMTSGAMGHTWGNEHVNHFDGSYPGALNTTATTQVKYLTQLYSTLPWWTFVPDSAHVVVTSGFGSYNSNGGNMYNATYATTAWNGSTVAVIYTPVATTLTVNMANFSKPMTASWYDPTTGTSTAIGSFTNSGSQAFPTPSATHSDGTNTHDWVLVLQ
jgi:hypothetical protein